MFEGSFIVWGNDLRCTQQSNRALIVSLSLLSYSVSRFTLPWAYSTDQNTEVRQHTHSHTHTHTHTHTNTHTHTRTHTNTNTERKTERDVQRHKSDVSANGLGSHVHTLNTQVCTHTHAHTQTQTQRERQREMCKDTNLMSVPMV